jgi:hypothetical protein
MTKKIEDEMARGAPQKITDSELIEAAGSVRGPSFTVSELADVCPIGGKRIRIRLSNLRDQNLIDSKKIGGTRVYWFEDHAAEA